MRPKPGTLGADVFGHPTEPPPDTPDRTLLLAHSLDLLPMQRPAVCHEYANGCVCTDCSERAARPPDLKPRRIRQPWEPLPLDRAA